jgi:hypothetical protein
MDLETTRNGFHLFDLESAKNAKEHPAYGYKYLYGSDGGGFEDVARCVLRRALALVQSSAMSWAMPNRRELC